MLIVDLPRVLLACGVFAALLPTGCWVVKTTARRRTGAIRSDEWALAIPMGLAVWSIPLTVAAYAGVFNPSVLGAIGWLGVAGTARWFFRAGLKELRSVTRATVAGLLCLALLGALYVSFPNESLLGNRDEGLYSLTALLLMRTGGLEIVAPAAAAAFPLLFAPFVNGQPFYLPGIYQVGNALQLQFPPLLPSWIAQFATATGGYGLFRASALFALGAVVVFHALARHFLRPATALLAAVLFALNPAQVWIARNNLVEPLAQLLVLGGLLGAVIALERRSIWAAIAAGALFGVASFGRPDVVLLAPLSLTTLVVATIWRSERSESSVVATATLAAATGVAQLVALVLLAVKSPIYVADNAAPLLAAGVAEIVAVAGLLLARAGAFKRLSHQGARTTVMRAAVAVLLLLFVYAALIRPYVEPFALVDRPGSSLDGMRDFRERSLPNLAAYLGWPVVAGGVVGAIIMAIMILRNRAHMRVVLIFVVFVAAAIAILANPRVSPDHFWGVRRFVPLVIPGVILLASYGLQALSSWVVGLRQRRLATMLTAAAVIALLAAQWPTLLVRENRGLTPQIGDVDDLLGKTSLVVVRDLDALATTLLVGYARPVLPLRDAAAPVNGATRAFWSRCTALEPCMMVHTDYAGMTGLALGASRLASFTREFIAPTNVPLPNSTTRETIRIMITPVYGFAEDHAGALVGAYRDWNVGDAGLCREEFSGTYSSRRTNGAATIVLPRIKADTLEIALSITGKGTLPVKVTLDGTVLQDSRLAGTHRMAFPLPPSSGVVDGRTLQVTSPTFNPNAGGESPDKRQVGVQISAVRQLDSATPRLGPKSGDDAFRSRVTVMGAPFAPPLAIDSKSQAPRVTIAVANLGNSVWPTDADVQEGEVPVTLGLVWRRRGDSARVLEQRASLAFALHPQERLLMAPMLDPHRPDGSALPRGEYVVNLDLLQEHVSWFAPRGGSAAQLSVTIR